MNTIERSSFNPRKYKESSDVLPENEKEDVFKGGDVIKIDVNKLESMVKTMRSNHHLKIKSLKGHLKSYFDEIITYVSILYDSSSYYVLHNIVKKHFGNIGSVSPGTVGAYFAGCLIGGKYKGSKGCTHICAGSAPLPRENGDWSFCDRPVVWANFNGTKYEFVYLSTKEDMSYPIMFLACSEYHSCPGFSDEEKKELKSKGIQRVELIGYRQGCTDYTNLIDESVAVDDLKTRGTGGETITSTFNGNGCLALVVIGLIIIFLVILFFCRRNRA